MISTADINAIDINVDELQIGDPEFWVKPRDYREAAFAALRREKPVSWHKELEQRFFKPGPGFWAITKHKDIEYISRNPQLFCSGKGATNIADMPPELLEFFGNLINADDPRHMRLRKLVSPGFTPAALKKVEGPVRASAARIVDRMIEKGEGNFVEDIAAPFPIQVICDLLGIPDSLHSYVFDITNSILGASDPEYVPEGTDVNMALMQSGRSLQNLMKEMREERLKRPTDDLTSVLVHAEIDGEKLTEAELCSFFVLVVLAGNETTRTAIGQGMVALSQFPEQKAIWQNDFEAIAPTAVEEIVRWASPVIFMRRTATEDTLVGDQPVKKDDKLVLFYYSANRDEDVFENPYQLDVRRSPNDHVGFGGPGPHFCLGAHLARREIKIIFDEIFRRMPDIEVCGEPRYLKSMFINGVKELPVRWTPGK